VGLVALLVAAGGCTNIFGSDEPNLSLRLYADPAVLTDTFLEIDVGGREYTLSPGQRMEPLFSLLGDVPVTVALKTSDQVLAAETFTLRFFENADHWIHALIGLDRPLGHCVGTLTAHQVAAPSMDSLYVFRGSIGRDVVC
jgi:hypothetical protein